MHGRWLLPLLLLVGCTDQPGDADDLDDEEWLDGKGDGASGVNIAETHLDVDIAAKSAVATIELERNGNIALEVGGLTITEVTDNRGRRRHRIIDGKLLVSNVYGPLVITYGFAEHSMADGLLPGGSTVIWPYFCGNLFPCHSQPSDGTTFSLSLDNVPTGKKAVYPETIATEAPPYMLAWAVGAYTRAELGTTPAGTKITVDWLPGGETAARAGTKNLVKV